jgi:membrane dipeptidase
VDHPRCTPDDIIRGVADSGGVLGVFMMSFWLTPEPEPTVEHLIRQLRHIRNVGGVEAVAIANDYTVAGQLELAALGNDNEEGVKSYHPWWTSMHERGVPGFGTLPEHVVIPELNALDRMFTIHRALEAAGFPPREVELIMGGNWTRVLTESLG